MIFIPSRSGASARITNGFAVTTITRGWSAEADKLLDYLENGIFDAIEKQYLRSFIFAIYLDPEDPNNIIEAYTFNFEYRRIAGADVTVPIMSLGEDLRKLSLGDGDDSQDPILLASVEGRLPTFRDTLIKTLIQAITQMDALPKRRYATYKAFYYPHTPASYEPPHFRPGDSDADRFIFSTHEKDEVPERWSVGKLETGWHGVNVHVASVSAYVPCAETTNGISSSVASHGANGTRTSLSAQKQVQIEAQKQDARERNIIWDAERISRFDSLDADTEFENCSDFPRGALRNSGFSRDDEWMPMGARTKEGGIELSSCSLENRNRTRISWTSTLAELRRSSCEWTDSLPPTQKVTRDSRSPVATGSLPPSDFSTQACSLTNVASSDIDTQVIAADLMKMRTDTEKTGEILTNYNLSADTIESFPVESPVSYDDIQNEVLTPRDSGNTSTNASDAILDCDCHVPVDDECILCDGGCKRWYHIWHVSCKVYHSQRDKRLPNEFLCFHCSLRKDKNWEIIKVQTWYEELLGNFSRLALFRRAIKIAEIHKPESSSAFAKFINCEPIVAAQLFKRLQVEGFIAPRINSEGISHPDQKRETRNGKGKVKQQRTVKQKYIFVTASKRGQKYRDYFDPSNAMQLRMMGMEDTVVCAHFFLTDQLHPSSMTVFWLAVTMRRCHDLSVIGGT
ncbi:HORMA domain-containing protein [Multifurca ochricompacta]|uniref:HORMA domain-containing protein n=1 Tax=Multifurca ochricompacta TaxID=376703 RepID=A0AAD4QRW1_9AGAM|nr:HORMA domain-containing protein [Multifurca ochricompacta]